MPRLTKIVLKAICAIIGLVLVIYLGVAIYVHLHKKELLVSITDELNKNMDGELLIGDMDPTFLKGFPGASLKLTNVIVRDRQWKIHHRTLLSAKKMEIAVNTMSLLRGAIEIKKINISQAAIYIYTDSNGYSNTAIFKKKKTSKPTESGAAPELNGFTLDNVEVIVDNQKGGKLFSFDVNKLQGKIEYPDSGWRATLKLNTLVKSLAFNIKKGSFIKDKMLQGTFDIRYENKTEVVTVAENEIQIGEEKLMIGAIFETGKNPADFTINIKSDHINWKNAYGLLTPNISKKLKLFNLEQPFPVTCTIAGNMGAPGNPYIHVSAKVRDNKLTTPGGEVLNSNFDGVFTNQEFRGRGLTDANSAIKLYHFKGNYQGIAFKIDTAAINNLERPVASGLFEADFDVVKLNELIGVDLLKFTKGKAAVKLAYRADIVDFTLTKPYVKGTVAIKEADISYVPRRLNFKNTAVSMVFTEKDLFINNLRLQSGHSIVNMEGSIKNFLNLYYNAPEKILLNWQIKSPELHLGEFLGFLSARAPVAKKKKKSSFSDDLDAVFESSNVVLNLNVNKVYYHKFMATNLRADVFLGRNGITVKNARVNHGGGLVRINGGLTEKNNFSLDATISNVNVKHFFYSFSNFGLTTLTSENLKGYLFSKAKIKGRLTESGGIVKNSINGHVIFDLKKGELINFDPITNVGKFAFPLRNLNNITFSNLNGKFDLYGERIYINPMKINSSVLNMNIAGIYSLGLGTNIALDIPLRNPKKDEKIEDTEERKKRRMKGIVLHVLATDGENGKIKLKWNKNHD